MGIYRVLNEDGEPISGTKYKMPVSEEVALKMYEAMIKTKVFDDRFYKLQKMGKISFYMENTGEEGAQVGSAAAFSDDDVIFFQYRELGTFFYRGYTAQECADTNYANAVCAFFFFFSLCICVCVWER